MSKTKKNIIYNFLYNLLVLIVPLITAPYLARVIGADGIGIYSYTLSIAQYFVLFAMLGLANYGNRSIAKVRDKRKRLSKEFFSIYKMQLISSSISILIYVIFILINNSYSDYFLIQLIYLISVLFDISWFFFGMEKFKLTVTRNTIIKILSTICIFVFVRSSNDLPIYVMIMAISTLLSQMLLWPFLLKEVDYCKVTFKDVKKHIKPNLKLFIPVIAISLYNIMDKIMLGVLCGTKEVGYYANAEKIVQIPVTLIGSLGTVMLPKISNLVSKRSSKKIKEYIKKSVYLVMFMAIPIFVGLLLVGRDFSIIFYGSNFEVTGLLIQVLSVIIVIKLLANIIRTQYLIPHEKDKVYIISVCLGAVINLILNLILIPSLRAMGASIGTIAAELAVMFYQMIKSEKELKIVEYLKDSIGFVIKAAIMGIVVYLIGLLNINTVIRLLLQAFVGAGLYFALNIEFIKSEILNKKKPKTKANSKKKEIVETKKVDIKKILKIVFKYLIIVLAVVSFVLIYLFIKKLDIVPDKYLNLFFIIETSVLAVSIILILFKKKVLTIISLVLAILILNCTY